MTEQTSSFLLKGLTQEHRDFLREYAQKNLGSSSRTKAIIAIINDLMQQENPCCEMNDELKNKAIENKNNYIENHQQMIEKHNHDILKAKAESNYDEIKNLSRKNLRVQKKRVQLSIPIYDFEYLQTLANNSKSSIQYYIIYVLYNHLYNERKLLGNEIEVLKKSNYELYKIGVNVNQIAKANNAGDKMELPINMLSNKIDSHVNLVMGILKSNSSIY
jgi:hypothetical protein